MAYVIKQNLLPSSKYNLKAPKNMNPKYITVHNTYNDASADNEVKYMISNNNQVSFHCAIDDKTVLIAVPYERICWHAGDGQGPGNMTSIGIEICYSKSGGNKYTQAEENAVQYIAKLLKEKGWGIDRVKQHYDWSKKDCPHRIRAEKRWASFLGRIESAMKPKVVESKPVVKPSQPVSSNKVNGTIKVLVDSLNYYDGPRWTKPTGAVKKNTVLTVVDKITVDGAQQYKLKSGTYITASDKYVKFTAK